MAGGPRERLLGWRESRAGEQARPRVSGGGGRAGGARCSELPDRIGRGWRRLSRAAPGWRGRGCGAARVAAALGGVARTRARRRGDGLRRAFESQVRSRRFPWSGL